MLCKTSHTRIPIISVNAVFLRLGSSTTASRSVRDTLTTRLIGCKSTPRDWDVLVADVSRDTTYDLEDLIASLSNDEAYQPQPDAPHANISPYE